MQGLFLLFLFSVSSVWYPSAFTLVWRVRRAVECFALLCLCNPGAELVNVVANEAYVQLHLLDFGGEGRLAGCYGCHHLH